MVKAGLVDNKDLKYDEQNFIAVYFLTEMYKKKQDPNYFNPYYDMLPGDTKDFPIFYSEEQLALLKGTSMI